MSARQSQRSRPVRMRDIAIALLLIAALLALWFLLRTGE